LPPGHSPRFMSCRACCCCSQGPSAASSNLHLQNCLEQGQCPGQPGPDPATAGGSGRLRHPSCGCQVPWSSQQRCWVDDGRARGSQLLHHGGHGAGVGGCRCRPAARC
jgi:hypothetical protein